jgi:hypothetical protein
MTRTLILIAALLVAASAARANIVLNTSPLSITLSTANCWTVSDMTWNSYTIMGNTGFNGTVFSVDGTWAGSGHGNETVSTTLLRVDGVAKAIIDGSTYNGHTIQFVRTSTLGNAYRLTSTLTVCGTGTDEQVLLDGLDASKSVDAGNAYGFLGTRNDSLSKYAAYDANKAVLFSGTSGGDQSFTHLTPAVAVAQYDPIAGKGVLSQVTTGANLALDPFIWNRDYDNKLYEDFGAMAGPAATNKHFSIRQTVTPFQAAPDAWMATTASLVTPEPGTLTLLIAGQAGVAVYAWRSRCFRMRLKKTQTRDAAVVSRRRQCAGLMRCE